MGIIDAHRWRSTLYQFTHSLSVSRERIPDCTENVQIYQKEGSEEDCSQCFFHISSNEVEHESQLRHRMQRMDINAHPRLSWMNRWQRLGMMMMHWWSSPTRWVYIHEHCQLFNSRSGKLTGSESIKLLPQRHSPSPSLPTSQLRAIDNPSRDTPDSCSKYPSAYSKAASIIQQKSCPTDKTDPVKQSTAINSDHISKKKISLATGFFHHSFKHPSSAFKELIGHLFIIMCLLSTIQRMQNPRFNRKCCCPIHFLCFHKHQIQLWDCTSHIHHHKNIRVWENQLCGHFYAVHLIVA